MLPLRVHRLAACFALAGYLLAGVLLVVVHHHPPHADHASCCDAAATSDEADTGHHHCSHAHTHQHGPHQHTAVSAPCGHPHHPHDDHLDYGESAGDAPQQPPHSHHDCAICRFLAQAVAVANLPVEEHRAELRQAITLFSTPAPRAAQPVAHFSRGPPPAQLAAR